MYIKITCGCGTRYGFEAVPVAGRMPVPVSCPKCGEDGTAKANGLLAVVMPNAANVVPVIAAVPSGPPLDIKVHCACGARYVFEVRPVDGKMPTEVFCTKCGASGTVQANELIRQAMSPHALPAKPPEKPIVVAPIEVPVPPPPVPANAPPVRSPISVPKATPAIKTAPAVASAPQVSVPKSPEPKPKPVVSPATPASTAPAPAPVVPKLGVRRSEPAPSAPPPISPTAPAPVVAGSAPKLGVHRAPSEPSPPVSKSLPPPPPPHLLKPGTAKPAKPAVASSGSAAGMEAKPEGPPCPKHHRQTATEVCRYCKQPICIECMKVFGYVCSARCRHEAETHGIIIPPCPHQNSVVESKLWQKVGRIAAAIAAVLVIIIGVWGWYAWVGSQPHVFRSTELAEDFKGAKAVFVDKRRMLLVGTKKMELRDLDKDNVIWTKDFATASAKEEIGFGGGFDDDEYGARPYHISADGIWVMLNGELDRFDLENGQENKTIPIPGRASAFLPQSDSILVVSDSRNGQKSATRVELPGGDFKTVSVVAPKPEKVAIAVKPGEAPPPTARALLAEELNGPRSGDFLQKAWTTYLPAGDGVVEFNSKLLKANVVSVQAMKSPGRSNLNANTSTSTSTKAVAEEIFNDMRRDEGRDRKQVDESTYLVTVRRAWQKDTPEWSGEVSGPASFFAAKTVDVVVGGKTLYILDKHNKKIAESKLTFTVGDRFVSGYGGPEAIPCVEYNDVLYFFDQGVLTAFELPSGNVRWRLTTVGVSRVTVDDKGMLYVNTTSASPESIQYSEQLNLVDKIEPVLLKVDAASGKILWKVAQTGQDCFLSGKYLYVTETRESGSFSRLMNGGSSGPAHFRIYRLNPGNGKVIWEYYHEGDPHALDFKENRILLSYGHRIDALKYLSF